MSGIVRGFMRPSALFDLRTGTFGEITAYSEEHAEEVRVVPLDDATLKTLAGEIWRHLDVFGVRLSDVDKGVRAALGLEGGA